MSDYLNDNLCHRSHSQRKEKYIFFLFSNFWRKILSFTRFKCKVSFWINLFWYIPYCNDVHLACRNAGIETLVIFRPVALLCRFAPLTLRSKHSDIPSEFVSKMTYPAIAYGPLLFALTPSMNQEDVLKEIHYKVECSNLDNKQTMQDMICVTLVFEDDCATERAIASVTGNLYVPPARAQYLSLIDRPTHQVTLNVIDLGVGRTSCWSWRLCRTTRWCTHWNDHRFWCVHCK